MFGILYDMLFHPIMVDNYAAFFNCTPVGRASDSMSWLGRSFLSVAWPTRVQLVFFFFFFVFFFFFFFVFSFVLDDSLTSLRFITRTDN